MLDCGWRGVKHHANHAQARRLELLTDLVNGQLDRDHPPFIEPPFACDYVRSKRLPRMCVPSSLATRFSNIVLH